MLCSCTSRAPQSISSAWQATKLELLSTNADDFDAQAIQVSDFGSASLTIHRDSSYELRIEVLKDLKVTQKIFGNTVTQTVIPAVYTTMRRGVAIVDDSTLTLLDQNQAILVSGRYQTWSTEMNITFTDANHRSWWSSWKVE